jgi:hypothetical protein
LRELNGGRRAFPKNIFSSSKKKVFGLLILKIKKKRDKRKGVLGAALKTQLVCCPYARAPQWGEGEKQKKKCLRWLRRTGPSMGR